MDGNANPNLERMIAAKDILDRGGFVKTDKVEVSAANPLFILPPKDSDATQT